MAGGGGGDTTSTSTTVNYSPEEAAQRLKVMQESGRIYGETAPSMIAAGYPGAKPIYYGPQTTAAAQNMWNTATQFLPQFLNQANQSLGFSLQDVLYPESNPALQAYMASAIRPITQSYMDPGGIMSQIRTQAGDMNQVGSSRQGIAEGLAAGRYGQAIGDTTAKIANEAYGQGLTAMGRAQTMVPQFAQLASMPSTMMGQVGSLYDTQNQNYENYLAAQRQWGLNAPWTPLQNYANIVFGGASPGTTTTGTVPNQEPSTLGKVAGSAAAGLGVYAALAATPAAPIAVPAGILMGALGLFS